MELSEFPKAMPREGLSFMNQRIHNYNATLNRLEACSNKYGGCDDCPDLIECREKFDNRCNVWTEKVKFNVRSVAK